LGFRRILEREREHRDGVWTDRSRSAGDEEGQVHDQFDVSLEDADLLGEVELTTNLIIAASESEEHLTTEQIDAILGVVPRARQGL